MISKRNRNTFVFVALAIAMLFVCPAIHTQKSHVCGSGAAGWSQPVSVLEADGVAPPPVPPPPKLISAAA